MGTIICSFLTTPYNKTQIIIGFLQLLTWNSYIGLLWSIGWGFLIFFKSG